MPHYQLLNQDPESLLIFLENNIIASGLLANSKVKNQPEHLILQKSATQGEINGQPADVYYIKNSGESSSRKALKSYICDYTKGNVEYCTLGRDAGFCFTITMNGCTFGIGQPADDGTVLVSHANTGGETVAQRSQTIGIHSEHNSVLRSVLEPALYRRMADRLTASTFGIKTGGGWKFYFQLYRPESGVFKCYGTFPIIEQKLSNPKAIPTI